MIINGECDAVMLVKYVAIGGYGKQQSKVHLQSERLAPIRLDRSINDLGLSTLSVEGDDTVGITQSVAVLSGKIGRGLHYRAK